MPNIAWEMDLGIVAYHSMKASFNSIANKTHKMMGISEKGITNKYEHYKNKTFNFKTQTIATSNLLDVLTIPSKNHYYSTLSICESSITQLGIWGNRRNKGKCVIKVENKSFVIPGYKELKVCGRKIIISN